jgi:hypothetical protein
MTADARLAEADVWINSNALKEFLVRHGGIMPLNGHVVILGPQRGALGAPLGGRAHNKACPKRAQHRFSNGRSWVRKRSIKGFHENRNAGFRFS